MKNLLILFGGQSSEHTVSRNGLSTTLPYIDRSAFNVTIVGITKAGEWFLTKAEPEEIANGTWEQRKDNLPALLSPNRMFRGLQIFQDGEMKSIPIDCVHPLMCGEMCEDGTLQGLFELCGIPYVGPDFCASACGMDKTVTKLIASFSGIRQADYCVVTGAEADKDLKSAVARAETHFNGQYPLFVKPASAGSSVGVSKAHNSEELAQALKTARIVCEKILVEETIVGREVEVAVLGNKEPKASVVGEVLAANEFYDFDAKYDNSASRIVIPAEISDEASDMLRKAALRLYKVFGCEGMSRVDFFLLPDGSIVFNEINTLPAFTKTSMYPKLWEATGVPYRELLTILYELAMERDCRVPIRQEKR